VRSLCNLARIATAAVRPSGIRLRCDAGARAPVSERTGVGHALLGGSRPTIESGTSNKEGKFGFLLLQPTLPHCCGSHRMLQIFDSEISRSDNYLLP